VEDSLSLLGITRLKDRSPQALSEGEKRKVAIASMLSGNPDVLLLDEPSSDLDPRTRVRLQEFLTELHRSWKTVIIATHDLEVASEASDRAVLLDERHRLAAAELTGKLLDDADLLLNANLTHQHAHRHGDMVHAHPHAHPD